MSDPRWGDPRHGLWRAVPQNDIVAPDGATLPMTGTAPSESNVFLTRLGGARKGGEGRVGECYRFQVLDGSPTATSGQPGQTWLNYALAAGAQRRVYGVSLGDFSWLVAGDAAAVWRAEVTNFRLNTSGAVWSLQPTIRLRRFGIFLGPVGADIYLESAPIEFNPINYIVTFEPYWSVEDVRSDGLKTVFALQAEHGINLPYQHRRPGAFFAVDIDFSGGSPTATWALVVNSVTQTTVVTNSWGDVVSLPDFGSAVGYFPSHDYSTVETIVVGMRFKAAVLELMKLVITTTTHATGGVSGSPTAWSASGSSTIQGSVRLVAGDTILESVVFSGSADYTASQDSGAFNFEFSAGSWSVGGIDSIHAGMGPISGASGWSVQALYQPVSVFELSGIAYFTSPGATNALVAPGSLALVARRFSNSIFGLIAVSGGHYSYRPVYGVIGSSSQTYNELDAGGHVIYCSEHPVSGSIARSITPTCWI